jgi:hypothetical protein
MSGYTYNMDVCVGRIGHVWPQMWRHVWATPIQSTENVQGYRCKLDLFNNLTKKKFNCFGAVVTTNNCNTFKITVIITHKVFNSHVKSSRVFYELPVAASYRELNWTPGVILQISLYSLCTDQAQKTQFCCCISKTTQRTSHVIPSQKTSWLAHLHPWLRKNTGGKQYFFSGLTK